MLARSVGPTRTRQTRRPVETPAQATRTIAQRRLAHTPIEEHTGWRVSARFGLEPVNRSSTDLDYLFREWLNWRTTSFTMIATPLVFEAPQLGPFESDPC